MPTAPRALACSLLIAACGGGAGTPGDGGAPPDAVTFGPMPALRHAVDLSGQDLALAALQRLGADVPDADERCGGCHGLTKQQLRNWRSLTSTATSACLTDLEVPTQAVAEATLECFRSFPGGPFDPDRMGIWAAGARLPWFQELARRAVGEAGGAAAHAELVDRAAMPPGGGDAFTQEEFDVVAEWFARGLPALDETLVTDPPPDECLPSIGPEVAAHVTAMQTEGWRRVNADASLAMFGCAGAATTLDCLADEPVATSLPIGTGWATGGETYRLLAELEHQTSYWSRASADGRFYGAGGGVAENNASLIVDLASNDHPIVVTSAFYDPAFFPDNQGFVFQGSARNVCRQAALLGEPATFALQGNSNCAFIDDVGLYEHVGRAPGGGDYFAISGAFVSDDGGHSPTLDNPAAAFGADDSVKLTPMIASGSAFADKPSTWVDIPFEGDAVLSPSTRMMATRLSGPGDVHLGFVVRQVVATPAGGGYDIAAPEVGRYCVRGGKPAFSYDERWLIYHHYVEDTEADAVALGFTGRADPSFDGYQSLGASNVHVIDLLTGVDRRVTNMAPGQYALFPHFRSDGWVYFQVRDTSPDAEVFVATDFVLRLETE